MKLLRPLNSVTLTPKLNYFYPSTKKLFIVNDTDDIGDDEKEDSAFERKRFDKDANGGQFEVALQKLNLLFQRNTSVANNNCKLGCEKTK